MRPTTRRTAWLAGGLALALWALIPAPALAQDYEWESGEGIQERQWDDPSDRGEAEEIYEGWYWGGASPRTSRRPGGDDDPYWADYGDRNGGPEDTVGAGAESPPPIDPRGTGFQRRPPMDPYPADQTEYGELGSDSPDWQDTPVVRDREQWVRSNRNLRQRMGPAGRMQWIQGQVVSLQRGPGQDGQDNVVLRVRTDDGQTRTVHLSDLQTQRRVRIARGDRITLGGYPARIGGEPVLMARQLGQPGPDDFQQYGYQDETFAPQPGMSPPAAQARPGTVRGELSNLRLAEIRGQRMVVGTVRTEDGTQVEALLGTPQSVRGRDWAVPGERVSLTGQMRTIDGRTLFASERVDRAAGEGTQSGVRPDTGGQGQSAWPQGPQTGQTGGQVRPVPRSGTTPGSPQQGAGFEYRDPQTGQGW